jgi:hypothetical protein
MVSQFLTLVLDGGEWSSSRVGHPQRALEAGWFPEPVLLLRRKHFLVLKEKYFLDLLGIKL